MCIISLSSFAMYHARDFILKSIFAARGFVQRNSDYVIWNVWKTFYFLHAKKRIPFSVIFNWTLLLKELRWRLYRKIYIKSGENDEGINLRSND